MYSTACLGWQGLHELMSTKKVATYNTLDDWVVGPNGDLIVLWALMYWMPCARMVQGTLKPRGERLRELL